MVREGKPLRLTSDLIGCPGGKRYCGYTDTIRPEFEYFLSYGIPGKLQGERYKKSPELVAEMMTQVPRLKAPASSIIFKRWDQLDDADDPLAVVFFATPDVVAGLFTLANYDLAEPYGVVAPFGAGCGSVVQYPYLEQQRAQPRCVLGLFDPSARPYVPANCLSFAVPMKKFEAMVGNMDESFLITPTWDEIRKRLPAAGAGGNGADSR
jgi:uncharacterized protein (DUF169 family)